MPETSRNCTKKLTPRQEAAAVELAAGQSIEAAAAKCHCAARTIKIWLAAVPEFKERIIALRADMTERTMSVLTAFSTKAALTLAKLLDSQSEKTRGWAAVQLLQLKHDYSKLIDLEARVRKMELKKKAAGPRTYRGRSA